MKEYLMICLVLFVIIWQLDYAFKTHLFTQKKFWILHLIVFILACVVDNVISGRPYVIFNPYYILNIRLIHVPVENFLFGFDLITLNLILFESKNKNHGA